MPRDRCSTCLSTTAAPASASEAIAALRTETTGSAASVTSSSRSSGPRGESPRATASRTCEDELAASLRTRGPAGTPPPRTAVSAWRAHRMGPCASSESFSSRSREPRTTSASEGSRSPPAAAAQNRSDSATTTALWRISARLPKRCAVDASATSSSNIRVVRPKMARISSREAISSMSGVLMRPPRCRCRCRRRRRRRRRGPRRPRAREAGPLPWRAPRTGRGTPPSARRGAEPARGRGRRRRARARLRARSARCRPRPWGAGPCGARGNIEHRRDIGGGRPGQSDDVRGEAARSFAGRARPTAPRPPSRGGAGNGLPHLGRRAANDVRKAVGRLPRRARCPRAEQPIERALAAFQRQHPMENRGHRTEVFGSAARQKLWSASTASAGGASSIAAKSAFVSRSDPEPTRL